MRAFGGKKKLIDPFTPRDLFSSGCIGGWWDFSDLTTMRQTIAGASLISASADPVGTVYDKSGNNNTVIAPADSATRPTYVIGGGLTFTNANATGLRRTFGSSATNNVATALAVFQSGTLVGSDRIVSFSVSATPDYTNDNVANMIYAQAGPTVSCYRNGNMSQGSFTTSRITLATSVFDGANHTMYKNGIPFAAIAKSTNLNANIIGIGNNAYGNESGYNDVIYEVIFLNKELLGDERVRVEQYLMRKWNIAI
jgi:hypothetical protein